MTDTISTQVTARADARTAERGLPHEGMRAAAVAGLAFVVLNVAGTLIAGAPPAANASASKIATYISDHAGALRAELLLGGLGIAALWWWLGALWRMLSKVEGERPRLALTAAVALAIGSALALVSAVFMATAAVRPIDVDTAHLLFSLSLITISAAGFGIAVFLIATCTVTARATSTPRWTAFLGYLAAAAFLVGTLGVVSDASVYSAVATVAFFVWCVWIAAMSVLMWRAAD